MATLQVAGVWCVDSGAPALRCLPGSVPESGVAASSSVHPVQAGGPESPRSPCRKKSRSPSQSCLCSSPVLRSFHMGIASSTVFFLPRSLRTWVHRMQHHLYRSERASHRPGAAPLPPPLNGAPDKGRPKGSSPIERPAAAPASVPGLGANRPFTPGSPAPAPLHRVQQAMSALRPVLLASTTSCRGAALEAVAFDAPACRPARIWQKSGTGRLVIAGRMADVCAELERMAALETGYGCHSGISTPR